MSTLTLPVIIPGELKQTILGIARGELQFTKSVSRQLAAAAVTRDQYTLLVERVQQRLEAVKTLEELEAQEARIGELRTQQATEWEELSADVIEKRSSVVETMRKTTPFDLALQLRDALLALAHLSELLDDCEAAAIAGEITTEKLQEIRAVVEQQKERVNQLDKLACDPTILI